MKSVFGALGYAAANLLHPRMLWLMIWPMLVAAGFWGIAALFLWVRTAMRIAEVIQSGLDYFHLQAPDAAMIAAHAALFLLFVPLVWLTALFILGVFGMGEMVEHVAGQSFPTLERRRGGGVVGSIANGIATLIGMLVLAVISLPLWLLVPLWPLIPLVIFAWANQPVALRRARRARRPRRDAGDLPPTPQAPLPVRPADGAARLCAGHRLRRPGAVWPRLHPLSAWRSRRA